MLFAIHVIQGNVQPTGNTATLHLRPLTSIGHETSRSKGGQMASKRIYAIPLELSKASTFSGTTKYISHSDRTVIIILVLVDGDERQPQCYAHWASDEDSAKRLVFKCTFRSMQETQGKLALDQRIKGSLQNLYLRR